MANVLAGITTSPGEPTDENAAWPAEVTSTVGAVVGGRSTYEAARH